MGKILIIKGANFSVNYLDILDIDGSGINYGVTYSLSNVTASTNISTLAAGASYSVTLTANPGFTMSQVTVLHGGLQVAPTGGGYTYNISSVSGDISIVAKAIATEVTNYDVTYNLTHVQASNNTSVVAEGSRYEVTLEPETGYAFSSVTVTHDGNVVTPTGDGYTYVISAVVGDIVITATAEESAETILATLTAADKISSGTKGYYKSSDGTYVSDSNYYGMWINVSQWRGKKLRVTANSSLSSRITFTTAYESYNGSAGNFATGWGVGSENGVYVTFLKGTTVTYEIPANAVYVWFYIYSGSDRTPSSILILDN
jgi:hypothetical protein